MEEYQGDMYAIKFYPVRFKRYENKFQLIANDFVMQNVIGTALKIFVHLLQRNSKASLGFIATASIIGTFKEMQENNQRFRVYKQIMQNFFGHETFTHHVDIHNSAYLMANKNNCYPGFVASMQQQFIELYPDMFNLWFIEI